MLDGGWRLRAACLAALLWSAAVLGFHWLGAAWVCSTDTSYCAHGREKDGLYRGRLVGPDGRPAADVSFTVAFESRSREHARDVGGFRTDAQGRFCIVWAQESITPFVHWAGGAETGVAAAWEPLRGAPPGPGCQAGDRGIPWNRADGLTGTPQYASVWVVALPALLLSVVGLLRGRRGRWAARAGLALATLTTLLTAVLWFL